MICHNPRNSENRSTTNPLLPEPAGKRWVNEYLVSYLWDHVSFSILGALAVDDLAWGLPAIVRSGARLSQDRNHQASIA